MTRVLHENTLPFEQAPVALDCRVQSGCQRTDLALSVALREVAGPLTRGLLFNLASELFQRPGDSTGDRSGKPAAEEQKSRAVRGRQFHVVRSYAGNSLRVRQVEKYP